MNGSRVKKFKKIALAVYEADQKNVFNLTKTLYGMLDMLGYVIVEKGITKPKKTDKDDDTIEKIKSFGLFDSRELDRFVELYSIFNNLYSIEGNKNYMLNKYKKNDISKESE